MTAAGAKIADEIRARGPMAFSRFMEMALYDARCGYYRVGRDPFGKRGDYYTAAQLQPVFGRVVASILRRWKGEMGAGEAFTVVEWGAGRGELAAELGSFRYFAVEAGRGAAPERFEGVVFANELFDALPVDVARRRDGVWRELRVSLEGERFVWVEGAPLRGASLAFAERCEGSEWIEVPARMRETMVAMTRGLERGYVVAIDYGFIERERIRFPRGTLMSYRAHQATEAVLDNPGAQDITAHVPFDELMDAARECELESCGFETLARWVLSLDQSEMEEVLRAANEEEERMLRLQLKTLLAGMGETFRVAIWRKG